MKLPFSRRSAEVSVFCLTRESINTAQISKSLQKDEDGAHRRFLKASCATMRAIKRVRFLEYDAYESMALKKLEEAGASPGEV
jgi:molybdopterin synthase catalytic subunit